MARIRFQPSGREISSEGSETVLAAALRSGLALPYSCRNGECGTCHGRLVSGEIAPGAAPSTVLGAAAHARGEVLLCQARPVSDLVVEVREVEAVAGLLVRTLPARVAHLERLTHDVMGITLSLPKGRGGLRFLAGQYVDVLLADGRRRSYSLAGPPSDADSLELHVRHVLGGAFSEYVFTELRERDLMRLTGPLGTFFLRQDARPAILVGGGTGLAPLAAMIEEAHRGKSQRPMQLYWGVRSERDLYYAKQLAAWQQVPGFSFTPVLSEPDAHWQGRSGWVHQAVLADHTDLSTVQVYASGPPAMIHAIREEFPAHGLAEDALFYDSFESAVDPAP
ncbi:MAG: 2Fe-2S iron-sulfur cluster binding domain-containing protein [Gammaproteobacteria bacterium]|jgi:CDP-4-dehydro-6-deoxyglucose reductase|nr:2Fe-2S iron-sulfur cluster binding domain-containing protein [Gammaproteobacteria bacterium]